MKTIWFILTLVLPWSFLFAQNQKEFAGIFQSYTEKRIAIDKYAQLNDIYQRNILEQDFNKFHEEKYLPLLKSIETDVCISNNYSLLECFIKFLDTNIGSSDEESYNSLGVIYKCHPDSVLCNISRCKNKKVLASSLYLGFLNISLSDQQQSGVILKNRLEEIMDKFRE
jgi:hypothetical protein